MSSIKHSPDRQAFLFRSPPPLPDCALRRPCYPSVVALEHGVQISRSALDDPLDLACDPSPVEVSRLRLDFFPVHETIPGSRIERDVALDGLEPFGGLLVGPNAVGHRGTGLGRFDCVVGRGALPFAEAAAGRGC